MLIQAETGLADITRAAGKRRVASGVLGGRTFPPVLNSYAAITRSNWFGWRAQRRGGPRSRFSLFDRDGRVDGRPADVSGAHR